MEASISARKEASDAREAAKLKLDEAHAVVEAKTREHEKAVNRIAAAKKVAGDAHNEEEAAEKAHEALNEIAAKKTADIVKAQKAVKDAKHEAETGSAALEEAIAKLKDAN